MYQTRLFLTALLAALLVAPWSVADEIPNYREHIRPLFRKRCVSCHGRTNKRGNLDLSTYAGILGSSDSGKIVRSGDADDSLLYLLVTHLEEPAMPPEGEPLDESECRVIKRWIDAGVPESKSDAANRDLEAEEAVMPSTPEEVGMPAPLSNQAAAKVFRPRRSNPITALTVERDVVARGGQQQVILQKLDSGELIDVLPFPEGEVFDITFSDDGTQLIAAGGRHAEQGTVVRWDLASGERLAEYGDALDTLMAVDLSPNGAVLVFGGPQRSLVGVQVNTGQQMYELSKHTDWIMDVAIDPLGIVFVSTDRSGNVFAWELETGNPLHTLRGHRGAVHAVDWLPSGEQCVTVGEDGSLRVWDLHRGQTVKHWVADPKGVLDLAVTKDKLWTVGREGTVVAWSLDGERLHTATLESLPLKIAATADQTVVGDWRGDVLAWPRNGAAPKPLRLPSEQTTPDLNILSLPIRRSPLFLQTTSLPTVAAKPNPKPAHGTPDDAVAESSDAFAQLRQRLDRERTAYEKIEEETRNAELQLADTESSSATLRTLVSDLVQHQARLEDADPQLRRLQVLVSLTLEEAEKVATPEGSNASVANGDGQLESWNRLHEQLTQLKTDGLWSAQTGNGSDNPWLKLERRILAGRLKCQILLNKDASSRP